MSRRSPRRQMGTLDDAVLNRSRRWRRTAGVGRPLNRLRVVSAQNITAANALDHAFASHPDSPVFHLVDRSPYKHFAECVVSPRILLDFANRVGNVLLAAGVSRGDRVAIYHTNGPEYFFLALAVIRVGGMAVPINSGLGLDGFRHLVEVSGCRVLLTDAAQFTARILDPSALPMVRTWVFPDLPPGFVGPGIALNSALESASGELAPAALPADAPVLLVHTSGTTGPPKLVSSTSGRLISGAKRHYLDEPVLRRNRTAVAGHFNHLVYYVGFYSSLMGNLPVWTIGEGNSQTVIHTIATARITIFFAFPDVYHDLYRHGLPADELGSVQIWVSTGDALHEVCMRAFCNVGGYLRWRGRALVGSVFVEAFGTSEIGFAALRRIRFSFSRRRLDRQVGRPTPAGPRVRIADAAGRPVRRNTVGRIEVKGPTVFEGYWDPVDALLHKGPVDGWWWTGDLGRQDRAGRFYQLDRAVDVIHTRAGPVYSLLLEEVLLTHPAVGDAVVIGVPRAEGEVPLALVIPRDPAAVRPQELGAWLRARTPGAALLEISLVSSEDLPRGLTGKVLRRVLRERYADHLADPVHCPAADADDQR